MAKRLLKLRMNQQAIEMNWLFYRMNRLYLYFVLYLWNQYLIELYIWWIPIRLLKDARIFCIYILLNICKNTCFSDIFRLSEVGKKYLLWHWWITLDNESLFRFITNNFQFRMSWGWRQIYIYYINYIKFYRCMYDYVS